MLYNSCCIEPVLLHVLRNLELLKIYPIDNEAKVGENEEEVMDKVTK
jgi:hypothetical protein